MKKFIEEFGFYIFILFSSFIIALFESVFPGRVPFKDLYTRALGLGTIMEEKFIALSKGNIYIENIFVRLAVFVLLFIIVISCILFLFRLFRLLKAKPLVKSGSFSPYPLWGLKDFFKIVIWIMFWIQVLGLSNEFVKLFYKTYTERGYVIISLMSSLSLDVITLITLIYWLRKYYRQSLQAVGVYKDNLFEKFKIAAFNYFSFLPLVFILLFISAVWLSRYQNAPSSQLMFYFLIFEKNPWIIGVTVLFIAVIGPFVEELLFRGLLYNSLKKSIGCIQAMLATSLLFSLLHMNLIGFLPILGLSLLFVYLYEKTGSLMVSVFVHMLHNSFLIFIIFVLRIYLGI